MSVYDWKKKQVPYMEFDDLSFRCYTPEEVEKLSILRITKTQSFDSVNYKLKFFKIINCVIGRLSSS